jgi:hypothetical protein
MDYHFKKERFVNIGTKNKGWRFNEAQKRKKFKGKYTEEIENIYQENLIKRTNGTSLLLQSKLRNRNKQKAEKRGTKLKGWEEKVRAWRIPHESKTSAMLRNFFLMLIKKAPKIHLLEETYLRRVIWEKEIIFKEAIEKKLNAYQIEERRER